MDDLISRQAAIDILRQMPLVEVMHDVMLIDKAEAMTELMLLPPAPPELRSEDGGDNMKYDKCFLCVHIGKGIYADYPVKYCKVADQYFMPFVEENGEKRKLDFSNIKDCKLWHGTGCNIHHKTVEKAKQEFLKSLDKVVLEGER